MHLVAHTHTHTHTHTRVCVCVCLGCSIHTLSCFCVCLLLVAGLAKQTTCQQLVDFLISDAPTTREAVAAVDTALTSAAKEARASLHQQPTSGVRRERRGVRARARACVCACVLVTSAYSCTSAPSSFLLSSLLFFASTTDPVVSLASFLRTLSVVFLDVASA